jgi:hypothetical protein
VGIAFVVRLFFSPSENGRSMSVVFVTGARK